VVSIGIRQYSRGEIIRPAAARSAAMRPHRAKGALRHHSDQRIRSTSANSNGSANSAQRTRQQRRAVREWLGDVDDQGVAPELSEYTRQERPSIVALGIAGPVADGERRLRRPGGSIQELMIGARLDLTPPQTASRSGGGEASLAPRSPPHRIRGPRSARQHRLLLQHLVKLYCVLLLTAR